MNRNDPSRLTPEQIQELIAWISEGNGIALSQAKFAEAVLDTLEDVSGFEAMTPSQANLFIHHLWSIYRGKEKHRS